MYLLYYSDFNYINIFYLWIFIYVLIIFVVILLNIDLIISLMEKSSNNSKLSKDTTQTNMTGSDDDDSKIKKKI
jgi:ABC-type Na+ efflux pump permease subunit